MKIILSRKGFDSGYGGCPSPILPDGTLLSMPIPGDRGISYKDIAFNGKTYESIWNDLKPKKNKDGLYAHLDPDIRSGIRNKNVQGWKAIFGQCGAAQSHLENQGVGVGDLFLFFGWFSNVRFTTDNKWEYLAEPGGRHVIYGYLQIGEIVQGIKRHDYYWHPHAEDYSEKNNTMYIASEKLIIEGEEIGKPGFGTLSFSDDLVLTKKGHRRTQWDLPDIFKNVSISYHTKESFADDYFQSAKRGQEFVISENQAISDWAKQLIVDNAKE